MDGITPYEPKAPSASDPELPKRFSTWAESVLGPDSLDSNSDSEIDHARNRRHYKKYFLTGGGNRDRSSTGLLLQSPDLEGSDESANSTSPSPEPASTVAHDRDDTMSGTSEIEIQSTSPRSHEQKVAETATSTMNTSSEIAKPGPRKLYISVLSGIPKGRRKVTFDNHFNHEEIVQDLAKYTTQEIMDLKTKNTQNTEKLAELNARYSALREKSGSRIVRTFRAMLFPLDHDRSLEIKHIKRQARAIMKDYIPEQKEIFLEEKNKLVAKSKTGKEFPLKRKKTLTQNDIKQQIDHRIDGCDSMVAAKYAYEMGLSLEKADPHSPHDYYDTFLGKSKAGVQTFANYELHKANKASQGPLKSLAEDLKSFDEEFDEETTNDAQPKQDLVPTPEPAESSPDARLRKGKESLVEEIVPDTSGQSTSEPVDRAAMSSTFGKSSAAASPEPDMLHKKTVFRIEKKDIDAKKRQVQEKIQARITTLEAQLARPLLRNLKILVRPSGKTSATLTEIANLKTTIKLMNIGRPTYGYLQTLEDKFSEHTATPSHLQPHQSLKSSRVTSDEQEAISSPEISRGWPLGLPPLQHIHDSHSVTRAITPTEVNRLPLAGDASSLTPHYISPSGDYSATDSYYNTQPMPDSHPILQRQRVDQLSATGEAPKNRSKQRQTPIVPSSGLNLNRTHLEMVTPPLGAPEQRAAQSAQSQLILSGLQPKAETPLPSVLDAGPSLLDMPSSTLAPGSQSRLEEWANPSQLRKSIAHPADYDHWATQPGLEQWANDPQLPKPVAHPADYDHGASISGFEEWANDIQRRYLPSDFDQWASHFPSAPKPEVWYDVSPPRAGLEPDKTA